MCLHCMCPHGMDRLEQSGVGGCSVGWGTIQEQYQPVIGSRSYSETAPTNMSTLCLYSWRLFPAATSGPWQCPDTFEAVSLTLVGRQDVRSTMIRASVCAPARDYTGTSSLWTRRCESGHVSIHMMYEVFPYLVDRLMQVVQNCHVVGCDTT